MKTFLVLLVCVCATSAGDQQPGQEHKPLAVVDIIKPSDGVRESSLAELSPVKRHARDVANILGGPHADDVATKQCHSDNLEMVSQPTAGYTQQTTENEVTIIKQRIERLENLQHSVDLRDENTFQSESSLKTQLQPPKETTPQVYAQEILKIPERTVPVPETDTSLVEENREHNSEDLEKVHSPLDVIVPPTSLDVAEATSPQLTLQEHLQRPARDVAHLLASHTTLSPSAEEEIEKNARPDSITTDYLQPPAEVLPTPQHFAKEIIQHVALQDHLQRHARDVVHLLGSSIMFSSKLNENNSVNDEKSAPHVNVQEHLDRQVKDVSHLLGTPSNLAQPTKLHPQIPQAAQQPPHVSSDNHQQFNEEVHRLTRDVIHLFDSSTTRKPHSDDPQQNEADYHQKVEVHEFDVSQQDLQHVAAGELLHQGIQEENVNVDLPKRIQRSADGVPLGDSSTAADQIVEDDRYFEKIVLQKLKKPTFGKKTKRSVESFKPIPEYIQHTASQYTDKEHNEASPKVQRSPSVTVDTLGPTDNVDKLNSHDQQHVALTRLARSPDVSTKEPLEISTQQPESDIVEVTTEAVDAGELVKPTVKVQQPHPRLPLTAFAQRNAVVKTTRRYPEVTATVAPKGIKKRY